VKRLLQSLPLAAGLWTRDRAVHFCESATKPKVDHEAMGFFKKINVPNAPIEATYLAKRCSANLETSLLGSSAVMRLPFFYVLPPGRPGCDLRQKAE
jgi:hypothetical protein